ncbi:class I SAM-dependent methyltransferase [Paraglaciecola sp.]|uniref:class I SAM-dependent methyltransferase n=1 Tax=Paraglaciecola sp. TaxID=1920173 RepID=UPI0030F42982
MQKILVISLLFFTPVLQAAQQGILSQTELTTLLSAPERPAADKDRDVTRQPVSVMAFTRVSSGDNVLDLAAGGGWYTELFSRAVGPQGKVYAQNDEVIWRFAEKSMNERTLDNRLANVQRLDNIAIANMTVPPASVDIAFTALNYHDLFFTQTMQDGKQVILRNEVVDYRSALAAIKTVLKDTGILVIIDHVAKAGSGYEAANNLHRIDPNIVKFQLEDAGFKLIEEAYYLRNSADDHSKLVFDPTIRGKTDRFMYKFVKQ